MDWNRLVPELTVNALESSRQFYCDLLGFQLRFDRPEDGFAYLDLAGAQLMLLQRSAGSPPLPPVQDRRKHFQIEVDALAPILARLAAAEYVLDVAPYTARYRGNQCVYVQREFFVRDPDGYLLRFFEHLAEESPVDK